jgi:uncharacterized protein
MGTLTISDPKLAEMVRRLVEGLKPEAIYLFGSAARGEMRGDSDYDLLVVVPQSDLPGYKRDQKAFRLLCGVGASKDVIVLTRAEFDRKLSVACSLPATVVREGRLLHAA